jgi:hypothetical protein
VRDFELDRPVDAVVMKANNMPESPVEPEWVVPVFLVVFTIGAVVTKWVGAVVHYWLVAYTRKHVHVS